MSEQGTKNVSSLHSNKDRFSHTLPAENEESHQSKPPSLQDYSPTESCPDAHLGQHELALLHALQLIFFTNLAIYSFCFKFLRLILHFFSKLKTFDSTKIIHTSTSVRIQPARSHTFHTPSPRGSFASKILRNNELVLLFLDITLGEHLLW